MTPICWMVWYTFFISGQPFTAHSEVLRTADQVIRESIRQAKKTEDVKSKSVVLDNIWVEVVKCPDKKSEEEEDE